MSKGDSRRSAATVGAALFVTVVVPATASAAADWKQGASVNLDMGLGSVMTDYNRNAEPGGTLVLMSLRGSRELIWRFGAQVVLRQWLLPGSEHVFMPGIGVRYRAYDNQWGHAFADLALGPASMDGGWHFGFDLGGAFEFDVRDVPGFSIGPFLRLAQVTNPDTRDKGDGRAWAMGVSFSYDIGVGAKAAAEKRARRDAIKPFVFNIPDTDKDGVTDDADQCVDVPSGRFNDRDRPGCPQTDEDNDGVPDTLDMCPLEPYGSNPDRKRPGCPISDRDKDGIFDADDKCPDQAGPASNDMTKHGCPELRPTLPKPEKPAVPAAPPTAPAPTRKKGLAAPGSR